MSPDLSKALDELSRLCKAQEAAFRAAQAAPQEFYIIGETRRERKRNDPRYNETAGGRVAADKEVVFAAREVVRLWEKMK
jgi:hypothetical protein